MRQASHFAVLETHEDTVWLHSSHGALVLFANLDVVVGDLVFILEEGRFPHVQVHRDLG